jgi:cytochrome c
MRVLLLTVLLSQSVLAADAALGRKVFAACQSCHSIDGKAKPNGPTLKGIVGRKAASDQGFQRYSQALKNSKITWTVEELDAYLKAPTQRVKGTSMALATPDAKRRAALIEYLKSLP